jgi:predicted small lipoprotein YifL
MRRDAPTPSFRAVGLAGLFAVFAALTGCGQRGPLVLPDSARPIERLEGSPLPVGQPGSSSPTGVAEPAPGAATGTNPPEPREPDPEDDESGNEARQPNDER